MAERLEGNEEGLGVVLNLLRRRGGANANRAQDGVQDLNNPQPQGQGGGGNQQGTPGGSSSTVHWPPALVVPPWMEEALEQEAMMIPEPFKCPISHSLMKEPTSTSSGHSYERSAIFQVRYHPLISSPPLALPSLV